MRKRDDKFPDNGFEAWGGYMHAKIAKLEQQFSSSAGKEQEQLSKIFNGVSIYVNGYTVPSADELKEIMAKHGGVYHTYQRSEDFIIASNLPDTKIKNMNLSKVVRPDWITDSISSKRLLNYTKYLLYGPSRTQPRIQFKYGLRNEVIDSKGPMITNPKIDFNNIISESTETSKPPMLTHCENNLTKNMVALKPNLPNKSSLNITKNIKTEVCKTAADPNFITEFYNNSRLHHISQLGACFKQYINDLRDSSHYLFPARHELKQRILNSYMKNSSPKLNFENGKIIMHIDMDCFFVSVGLRTRPELRGKPVAVTHSKGGQPRPKRTGVDRVTEFNLYRQKQAQKMQSISVNMADKVEFKLRVDDVEDEDDKFGSMSEIASCSYEARAKGISNGMFMGAALKLCPDLQTIPYDFDGYKEVAYTLYNTLAKYTLDIEAVSCDEMYVDCKDLLNALDVRLEDFATALRDEIKNATGCPCSTGFGSNRLQARLATKKAKPDGQFFLNSDLVDEFMLNIKLKDLPGVGRQTAYKLESLGHQTCGSLQSLPLKLLQQHLGHKTGAQLYEQIRGIDSSPLTYYTVRKSVSAEVNYGIRFENIDQCEEFLTKLSEEVQSRMQQFKVLGKCVTLKLMVRAENAPVETAKFMGHGYCDIINKSAPLLPATSNAKIIAKEVISLCKKLSINPKEMRGVGIQVTKLESIGKQIKGSLNKYLTDKLSTLKTENMNVITNHKENDLSKKEFKLEKDTKQPSTPKKGYVRTSPLKKSPIIGQLKSPQGKRKGRPSKNTKPVINLSKNLMVKYFQGQTLTKDVPKKETVVNEENSVKEQTPQGLLGLPWDKVRELLRAWFDSGQTPKSYDVDLIAVYMREMVVNKNIDKLNILVRFMRRRIHLLNSSIWFEVQERVMEEVQSAMLAIYGKKLWICDD